MTVRSRTRLRDAARTDTKVAEIKEEKEVIEVVGTEEAVKVTEVMEVTDVIHVWQRMWR